jgi:hypothetical protein
MTKSGFDYDLMVEEAMRGVVRQALRMTIAAGLPDNHHFYISFLTGAEGVAIPPRLKMQYPEEMTIVIQHQFWNLVIHDEAFEVELAFSGKREHLFIPFAALTGFVDPEAQFGLKFGVAGRAAAAAGGDKGTIAEDGVVADADADNSGGEPAKDGAKGNEKIVSLDQFRKK